MNAIELMNEEHKNILRIIKVVRKVCFNIMKGTEINYKDLEDIIEFIRNYNITETLEGSFINNATKSNTLSIIQKRYGLSKLDNIQLRKKDVENILTSELFFD